MQIKTWRDPYDAGFNTTIPREIDIEPGLTVLVGCNGAGKTTLLMNIKEHCKTNNIPCHLYDNLNSGGHSALGGLLAGIKDLDCDNMGLAATIWSSSEGEAIRLNICRQSTVYKEFLATGFFNNSSNRLSRALRDTDKEQICETNKRVLLFDATDSGLSIDNICDIKALFKTMLEDAKQSDLELYIILSANEYELCREEDCFDVVKGRYIRFKDYEDYRNFILKSRQNKEKRIEKQLVWAEKQKQKEKEQYKKLKETVNEKIAKIKENAGEELSWSDKNKISSLEWQVKDFVRHSRFLKEE